MCLYLERKINIDTHTHIFKSRLKPKKHFDASGLREFFQVFNIIFVVRKQNFMLFEFHKLYTYIDIDYIYRYIEDYIYFFKKYTHTDTYRTRE